jgi:type III restriction enzyme
MRFSFARAPSNGVAMVEEQKRGTYIRPIVLFQAQPRGKEDAATFEKLKAELIGMGIPKEQIAIKTSERNELKGAWNCA